MTVSKALLSGQPPSEWWRKPLCLGFVVLFCIRTILRKASACTRLAYAKTWPNFSFRVAYAHRIFDDATQCKSCFRIASASACLELSSATASPTFRYAGFSLRKRNSRTSPLCNFIMEVFDAAQVPFKFHLFRVWNCILFARTLAKVFSSTLANLSLPFATCSERFNAHRLS